MLGVGAQLGSPPLDLAFEPAVALAEVGEADGDVVDAPEGGDGIGHREAEVVLHRPVGCVRLGDRDRRVEPVTGSIR